MKSEHREARERQIFDAAYKLLEKKGYKATSMLAVAKAASASNETMYSWFGNKQGLVKAMVEANAESAMTALEKALAADRRSGDDALSALRKVGPAILTLVTGERAVALDRAAAAEAYHGGELGKLIAIHSRDTIAPMLEELIGRASAQGIFNPDIDVGEIVEIYIALLIGDAQIRRVTGAAPVPDPGKVELHSERVIEILLDLYGAKN